jgi:hypothetical protein
MGERHPCFLQRGAAGALGCPSFSCWPDAGWSFGSGVRTECVCRDAALWGADWIAPWRLSNSVVATEADGGVCLNGSGGSTPSRGAAMRSDWVARGEDDAACCEEGIYCELGTPQICCQAGTPQLSSAVAKGGQGSLRRMAKVSPHTGQFFPHRLGSGAQLQPRPVEQLSRPLLSAGALHVLRSLGRVQTQPLQSAG